MSPEPKSPLSSVKPPPASLSGLFEVHMYQAVIFSGRQPNPQTNQTEKNLDLAKHNVDMLDILQEKTEGNRTREEDEALRRCLHVARMAYVGATREADEG